MRRKCARVCQSRSTVRGQAGDSATRGGAVRQSSEARRPGRAANRRERVQRHVSSSAGAGSIETAPTAGSGEADSRQESPPSFQAAAAAGRPASGTRARRGEELELMTELQIALVAHAQIQLVDHFGCAHRWDLRRAAAAGGHRLQARYMSWNSALAGATFTVFYVVDMQSPPCKQGILSPWVSGETSTAQPCARRNRGRPVAGMSRPGRPGRVRNFTAVPGPGAPLARSRSPWSCRMA
jgi:hypothetical protein